MAEVDGLVLDMEGVLVNTEPLHFEGYRKVFEGYGVIITQEVYNDFWIRQGKGIRDFLREKNLNLDPDEIRSKKRNIYRQLLNDKPIICRGVLEKLEELSQEYPLAIYTMANKTDTEIILGKTGIENFFQSVVTGDDVNNPKPDPEGYLLSSERLKIPKERIAAIGDAEKDIKGAKAAGMICVAIPNKYTEHNDFSMADYVASSIGEISPSLFEKLQLHSRFIKHI